MNLLSSPLFWSIVIIFGFTIINIGIYWLGRLVKHIGIKHIGYNNWEEYVSEDYVTLWILGIFTIIATMTAIALVMIIYSFIIFPIATSIAKYFGR